LGGIADQFSVTTEQIQKWNGLRNGHVGRGMLLRIYTVGGGMPETHTARNSPKTRRNKPVGGNGSQSKP